MTQSRIDDQLTSALHHYFGFKEFRPGQLDVLQAVMSRRDTLAVLPTGGGKTLLYQLPTYLNDRLTIVISPLISLMQDQVDRLHAHGEKRVIMLSSNLTGRDRATVLRQLSHYRFVFASPEILANQTVITSIKRANPGLFVIDEAHCISQWGPDFRPQYLLLKEAISQLNHPPVLMLTATATPQVRQDILIKLGLESSDVSQVIKSVNRPNIFLAAKKFSNSQEKQDYLTNLVEQLGGRGIIYVSSRRMATELAALLSMKTGLAVAAYHAGIDSLDRYRLQHSFMVNELDIICATSAFGMGIDKDDVRYVIHYQMPGALESYVQEVGRAGRDGQPSLAILLNSPGDDQLQQSLHHVDLPAVEILDRLAAGKINPKILGDRQDLIMFYLQHGYGGQSLQKLFDHRERLSNKKIAVMDDYLQTNLCRRQFIMDYFGETVNKESAHCCCDNDDPDWQVTDIFPKKSSNPVNKNIRTNWQSKIHAIFGLD